MEPVASTSRSASASGSASGSSLLTSTITTPTASVNGAAHGNGKERAVEKSADASGSVTDFESAMKVEVGSSGASERMRNNANGELESDAAMLEHIVSRFPDDLVARKYGRYLILLIEHLQIPVSTRLRKVSIDSIQLYCDILF